MKHIFPLLGVIALIPTLLIGCDKLSSETTYTFRDDFGTYQTWASEFNPSAFDINIDFYFKEYYDHNCINIQHIHNPEKGKDYSFTANSKCEYVVVSEQTDVKNKQYSSINTSSTRYISVVYYLTPGKNTSIVLDAHTIITSKEPAK